MQNVISQHIENLSLIFPATEGKIKLCPSLSARNRETTKVDSRFSFYSRGKLAYQQVEKENQNKHRQVFADFLQRITKQGWASEAKTIPTPTKEENKSEQTQQNYSYHPSHFTSKNIQLWKKRLTCKVWGAMQKV